MAATLVLKYYCRAQCPPYESIPLPSAQGWWLGTKHVVCGAVPSGCLYVALLDDLVLRYSSACTVLYLIVLYLVLVLKGRRPANRDCFLVRLKSPGAALCSSLLQDFRSENAFVRDLTLMCGKEIINTRYNCRRLDMYVKPHCYSTARACPCSCVSYGRVWASLAFRKRLRKRSPSSAPWQSRALRLTKFSLVVLPVSLRGAGVLIVLSRETWESLT